MTLPTCDWPLSQGGKCGRPIGHTDWSIETGWPRDTVSVYAHSAQPQPYDAEVAPYLGSTAGVTATSPTRSPTPAPTTCRFSSTPPTAPGDSFAWIICRPGKASPHDLRTAAEARVAEVEAQLRAAGIEPVAAPADDQASEVEAS